MRLFRGLLLGALLLTPLAPALADPPAARVGQPVPDTLRIGMHTDALTLNPAFTASVGTTVRWRSPVP